MAIKAADKSRRGAAQRTLQRVAFLVGSLLLPFGLRPAQANAEGRISFAIPAGTLGGAIEALSLATGASIRLSDDRLWYQPTPALSGRFTELQALSHLLSGSNAVVSRIGPNAWLVSARLGRPATRPASSSVADATDIIVAASKMSASAATFAGKLTIVDGPSLLANGPVDITAIGSRAASVTSTHFGSGRDKIFLGGIADSGLVGQSQATVGQYLDDVRLSYAGPDPALRLYDIASVEILEGPQGTLYGADAPGGVIRLVRNRPDLEHMTGSLSIGEASVAHGAAGAEGAAVLNVPIPALRAGFRLVGYGDTLGGFINEVAGRKNINRVDTSGGRGNLRFQPDSDWTIDLGVTGQRIFGHDSQYADRDAPALSRHSVIEQPFVDDYRMGELVVGKRFGAVRLTSVVSVARQRVIENYDATEVPASQLLLKQRDQTRLLTADVRLARPLKDHFSWVMGMSVVRNQVDLSRNLGAPALSGAASTLDAETGVKQVFEEASVYGEATYELRPFLLTAGGRLSQDGSSGNPEGAAAFLQPFKLRRKNETLAVPSVALSAQPREGVVLFARYQEGYRPSGITMGSDLGQPAPTPEQSFQGATPRRYGHDHVATAVAGGRFHSSDRGLEGSAALSFTRWNHIQADYLDPLGLPVTTNIGDGRILTLDAHLGWKVRPAWKLEAEMVFNDSRLTSPDGGALLDSAAGANLPQSLPNVAPWSGRLASSYSVELGSSKRLQVEAWVRYLGKSRFGVGPLLGNSQGGYVDNGLSLRLSRGHIGISASVTNLADATGNRFAIGVPFDVARSAGVTPLQPRTVHVGVEASF